MLNRVFCLVAVCILAFKAQCQNYHRDSLSLVWGADTLTWDDFHKNLDSNEEASANCFTSINYFF